MESVTGYTFSATELSSVRTFLRVIAVPIAKRDLCVAREGAFDVQPPERCNVCGRVGSSQWRPKTAFISSASSSTAAVKLKSKTEPTRITILFVTTYSPSVRMEGSNLALSSRNRAFRMSRTARTDRLREPLDLVF